MHLHRPFLPLALLGLLLACDPKDDTATPDSGEGAAFHGQAWAMRTYRPVPPFDGVCTRADGASDIPLADCWACVHLQDDGTALAWWGEVTASTGPYDTTGQLDLGTWTLVTMGDRATYQVDGETWEVEDRATSGDPWSQTALLTLPTGQHQLHQPGACDSSPPPLSSL